MGGLQRFEQKLEQAISGVFARTFRSAVQPVEIAAALQRELDNEAQILSRERRLVPNAFSVELAQSDLERLAPYDSALAAELTEQLQEHADLQSYVFPGPIRINFVSAGDLGTGRFRVLSRAEASVSGHARYQTRSRTRAVLEVNGTRHPLQPPGLVGGRGSDADLRINDPGVSRRHVEIRVDVAGRQVTVSAIDLGSTNGTSVDGRRVQQALLRDGSTIVVGNTTMVVRDPHGPNERSG